MLPSACQGRVSCEGPGIGQGLGSGLPSSPGGCPLPRGGPAPAPLRGKTGTAWDPDVALALERMQARQPHSHVAARPTTVLDGFARCPDRAGGPASTAAGASMDAAGSTGFRQGAEQHVWPACVSAERGPPPDATPSCDPGGWEVQEVPPRAQRVQQGAGVAGAHACVSPTREAEEAEGRWAVMHHQQNGLLPSQLWEQSPRHLGGNSGGGEVGGDFGGGSGPGLARIRLPAANDGADQLYADRRAVQEVMQRGQGFGGAREGSGRRPYADERSLEEFMQWGQELESALLRLHMEREALAAEAAHFPAQACTQRRSSFSRIQKPRFSAAFMSRGTVG